ncbi:MAG TPA: hypothetical protein VF950_14880 [Planctomycetota bacterium]
MKSWVPLSSFALAVLLSQLSGAPGRLAMARQATSGTCDWITLPVCVRPIKAKPKGNNPPVAGGSTTNFTAEALKSLQDGISLIWARCCIAFTVTLGKEVELPADAFLDGKLAVANSDGQNVTPNEGLRKLFKTANSKKCLNLYFAADVVAGGLPAGADLKGAALVGDNGMIVDDGASPGVAAHEAGHNLGLTDNQTAGNLMSGADTAGNPPTGLDDTQCALARTRAKSYLQKFQ